MADKVIVTDNTNTNVSFFTNCYEGDWKKVLIGDRLQTMITRCNVDFSEKILIINNVKDRALVEQHAKQAVDNKIIDAYYFSEDYSEQILTAFSITRKSFCLDYYDGYWYSMGPLSAIYFCESKYLLYFTCDCMIADKTNWVNDAISLFDTDSNILAANPVWDNNIEEARKESFKEDDNWFYSRAFSDQCFLVENARLYGDIYNFYNKLSERYPIYAGNLFERRIDNFINTKQLVRITNKNAYYIHEKLVNDDMATPVNKSFNTKKLIKKIKGKVSRQMRTLINRN